MVMPSKCPFCEKIYGDSELHWCEEWTRDIAEKAKKSREDLWIRTSISGVSVPSKDDN